MPLLRLAPATLRSTTSGEPRASQIPMVKEHLMDAQQGNTRTTSRMFFSTFSVVVQGVRLGKGRSGTCSVDLATRPAAAKIATHPVATAKIVSPVKVLRNGEAPWASSVLMGAPSAPPLKASRMARPTHCLEKPDMVFGGAGGLERGDWGTSVTPECPEGCEYVEAAWGGGGGAFFSVQS